MSKPQARALGFDREFAAAVAGVGELAAAFPELPVGDVDGRRTAFDEIMTKMKAMMPPQQVPGLTKREHKVTVADGSTISLFEFRPSKVPASPSPAIYHVHGGGMILGSVEMFEASAALKAEEYGLPFFSINYRLAPEHPHPTPVHDAYSGLTWLHSHASELGIDSSRILVIGDSAGGGIAGGMVLMARDKQLDPPIALQMLIYPMLDDRNIQPHPDIDPFTMWKTADNETGWRALLGSAAAQEASVDGHEYAAPARANDLAGLPPTYIDVGQLDLFAKEDLQYAARLADAGVAVEFHLYPGLPHAFERMGATTSIVKSAVANRKRVVEDFKLGEMQEFTQ
ncbi:hypothetical protein LTR86_007566 [Recurvomyces mirabilis]|nr:hypothetical protein LTR86_007566 [Recurvomyces mirabilis]